jgi:hypothetical protein
MADATSGKTILKSDWTGLSDHLIAKFYPVERKKSEHKDANGNNTYIWQPIQSEPEVWAPISDGSIDTAFNWHSAFEGVGADQKWSAISALLQTGALKPLADLADQYLLKGIAEKATTTFEGKTSVTKLNSTQVFTGLPPATITFTAHFRAYADPSAEVAAPVNQLMMWAHPQELAQDGFLLEAAQGKLQGLYPSKIPRILAMKYAGSTYLPLVLDGLPVALTPPRDAQGRMLAQSVSIKLQSLSSLDARDWQGGWKQQ